MSKSKFLKALILLLIATLIASFSVVGCKEEAVTTEESETEEEAEEVGEVEVKEPIELTVWWWGESDTPGLEKYMDNRAEAYNELNPNVTVTMVLQPTETTIPNFKAAAEAQKGPDIATIWYGVYQLEEVWADNVEPLDNWIEPEEYEHWIGRKPLSTYDGTLWASDLYIYGNPVVYNKDLFREVGLDPEKPPVTWDEFIEYCEIFKNAGIVPIAAGWLDSWSTISIGTYFLSQKVTAEKLMKAGLGEYSFTDPEFKIIWDAFDELISNEYFGESGSALNLGQGWQEWRKGNGAFAFITSQTSLDFYNDLGPETMGYMSPPSFTEEEVTSYWTVPISLFITKWSPNKAVAADFLKFLRTEESMNKMVEMLDGICIPADDRFDIDQIEDPVVKDLNARLVQGLIDRNYNYDALLPWGIIGDGMLTAGGKLYAGEITKEEAGQYVEDAAQIWRDLNPETLERFKIWSEEF